MMPICCICASHLLITAAPAVAVQLSICTGRLPEDAPTEASCQQGWHSFLVKLLWKWCFRKWVHEFKMGLTWNGREVKIYGWITWPSLRCNPVMLGWVNWSVLCKGLTRSYLQNIGRHLQEWGLCPTTCGPESAEQSLYHSNRKGKKWRLLFLKV